MLGEFGKVPASYGEWVLLRPLGFGNDFTDVGGQCQDYKSIDFQNILGLTWGALLKSCSQDG